MAMDYDGIERRRHTRAGTMGKGRDRVATKEGIQHLLGAINE